MSDNVDNYTRVSLRYQAEKEYDPEVAEIILGVVTTDEDLNKAFTENSKKMDTVRTVLEEKKELELSTLTFQVVPKTKKNDEVETVYYEVLNQLKISTENMTQLGEIIQQAITSGANQVISIRYMLEDREKAEEEVIEEALTGLKNKAEFIARRLDGQDYKLISLDVNNQYITRDYGRYMVEGTGMKMADTPMAIPPISPQKIRMSVNLNATIALQ